MKANELMIGDWVKFPIGNEKVIDLPYIEGRGICASFAASATLFPVEIEKLEPIPLTAEILEKNGFDVTDSEVAQYHFEEDGQKMHFSLRKMYDKHGKHNGYSFWAFNILPLVIYVHELQHALKLCGIDKEITV